MKPIEVKDNTFIDSIKEVNDKDPKFRVGDHVRISKKTFLLKDMLQIGLKKVFWLKKLKILFHGQVLLTISVVKKLSEHFIKESYKKQVNKNLRNKKLLKEKKANNMSNGKEAIIHLIAELIKKS